MTDWSAPEPDRWLQTWGRQSRAPVFLPVVWGRTSRANRRVILRVPASVRRRLRHRLVHRCRGRRPQPHRQSVETDYAALPDAPTFAGSSLGRRPTGNLGPDKVWTGGQRRVPGPVARENRRSLGRSECRRLHETGRCAPCRWRSAYPTHR